MPIKGISDIRRFSRGGKIRLGEKRQAKSGKDYPAKLDHFLFDPDDAGILPALKEQYGDKPRSIRVAFPSEHADVVYPQWFKLYTATGLRCKGDGVTATRVSDDATMQDFDCAGPDICPFSIEKGMNGKPGCKRLATLNFFLVDWNQMFVWQINTTGFHSIVNINSGLDLLRNIAGRISFVPVNLVIKPVTVQPDGKKQVAYALDLVIPVGLNQLKALRPLVGNHVQQAALPAPVDDDVSDDLYPASQIGYDDPVVDEDGVVQEPDQEPEPDPEPNPAQADPPYDDLVPPEPEPDKEPEPYRLEDLPEVQDLMRQRPAIARAILGQAKGENWPAQQVLDIVRTKLGKEPAHA